MERVSLRSTGFLADHGARFRPVYWLGVSKSWYFSKTDLYRVFRRALRDDGLLYVLSYHLRALWGIVLAQTRSYPITFTQASISPSLQRLRRDRTPQRRQPGCGSCGI